MVQKYKLAKTLEPRHGKHFYLLRFAITYLFVNQKTDSSCIKSITCVVLCGSRKIRRKQVCRRKTRLRKFRRSQILYPPPCTLPPTFTYRACPFGVHCLSPIRRNFPRRKFLRRVFLRQTCLRRIFLTGIICF